MKKHKKGFPCCRIFSVWLLIPLSGLSPCPLRGVISLESLQGSKQAFWLFICFHISGYKIAEECQGYVLLVTTALTERHKGWSSGPTVRHHRAADQWQQADCMSLLSDIVMVGYWGARDALSSPVPQALNPQPKLCLRSGWFQMNSPHSLLGKSLPVPPQPPLPSLPLSRWAVQESACKLSLLLSPGKELDNSLHHQRRGSSDRKEIRGLKKWNYTNQIP